MIGIKVNAAKTTHRTKDRILQESAKLFAARGYDAVSVRDIGEAVNVNAGSIYTHYESKQAILDTILDLCDEQMDAYYARLERNCQKANTIEAFMDSLFSEFKQVKDIFHYYAVTVLLDQYMNYDRAREIYFRHFLDGGRIRIARILQTATDRGLCGHFDTDSVAQLIITLMSTFYSIRVLQAGEVETTCDLDTMYTTLEAYFLRSIQAGV